MSAVPADVFVNFYEVLNVSPTADVKVIEERIKEETRTWRKRTGSPDLSKRQEAELRMQHLSAARDTLLDAGRRSAFDRRLATERTETPRRSAPSGGRDWVALAEEYLAQNDYGSAAYAAREATQVEGNSPRAWNLRGRANAGLGNHNDALYEVRQAAEIEPNNAQFQFDMGSVCEQMERWKDALTAYESASRIEPSAILYRVSVAGVYLQNDLPGKALPLLEQMHTEHPKDELVGFYLASSLRDVAENVPTVRQGAAYMITSASEVEKMGKLIDRAKALPHGDRDLAKDLDRVHAYIQKSTAYRFSGGCGPVAVVALVLFIGIVTGFSMLSSGGAGGVVVLLVFGLLSYAAYRYFWVPGWRDNSRNGWKIRMR